MKAAIMVPGPKGGSWDVRDVQRPVIGTGQGSSVGVATDSTSVYWTNAGTSDFGTVMKRTPK